MPNQQCMCSVLYMRGVACVLLFTALSAVLKYSLSSYVNNTKILPQLHDDSNVSMQTAMCYCYSKVTNDEGVRMRTMCLSDRWSAYTFGISCKTYKNDSSIQHEEIRRFRHENYSESCRWMFLTFLGGLGLRIRNIQVDFGTDPDRFPSLRER